SALGAGSHPITVVYSGDGSYLASTSAVLSQTVNRASSALTIISSRNPIIAGLAVTFTASLTHTPASATGSIQFLDAATVLGTVAMSGGQAKLSIAMLSAGTHTVIAGYSGDALYAPALWASETVTVAQVKPTVTVGASPDPAQVGQTVTLTATISGTTATGT